MTVSTSVPFVLLLLSRAPQAMHGGDVLLRDLLRSFPRQRLHCIALSPEALRSHPHNLEGFPVTYVRCPRESGIGRLGPRVARMSSTVPHLYVKLVAVPALVKQAARIGLEKGVDVVWTVLNRPTVIHAAQPLARALGTPLISSVWDPPERLAVTLGMGSLPSRSLLKSFGSALRASVACSVISENMKEEYQRQYNVKALIMRHGVHPNLVRPPAKEIGEDRIVIGIAGSIYAEREWQAFLSALASVDWSIGKRQVVVKVLSSNFDIRAENKMHVEYLGWRSFEETIAIMSQVDITYIPYWFERSQSPAARLSFPTKLATYLAAGRPVLYHGPQESSVAQFIARFSVGLSCHSLQAPDIIATLNRFVADKELYARAADQTRVAVEEELSLHVLRRRFSELMGITERDLVPL